MTKVSYTQRVHNSGTRFEKVSDKPSMTVPDMAMSMPEIMSRYLRGQELPLGMNTYFDGDDDNLDFDSVDPTKDPAFDLSDYSRLSEEISERKRAKTKKEEIKQEQQINDVVKTEKTEGTEVNDVVQHSINSDAV